ncbi:hypothetical protein HPG69_015027 [Diceros bicornis minor]|uniref:Uncharacterized protein n=1 Tax=Diceros bicornis minor TaxID=77932 RepID=A0A7J7FK32_DICBM|nr:hypothetical protein HPG69_015027 [Diceros bicornis minor]
MDMILQKCLSVVGNKNQSIDIEFIRLGLTDEALLQTVISLFLFLKYNVEHDGELNTLHFAESLPKDFNVFLPPKFLLLGNLIHKASESYISMCYDYSVVICKPLHYLIIMHSKCATNLYQVGNGLLD